MLATRGSHVPTGGEWVHEVKWDGMRILADATGDRIRLSSRNENDVTVSFPELRALAGRDLLLDGEVVVFEDGRPDFGALGERMHVRDARRAARLSEHRPVVYLVFDVLRVDGRDLAAEPLSVRRKALESLDLTDASWQVPPVYDDGAMLWEATRQQRLEGVVSKRLSSPYRPGLRSPHWLKFPHRRRTSWVVCGWRFENGSEHRLGALLLGEPTEQGVVFRGRVGSGVTGVSAARLKRLLEPLTVAASPFVDALARDDTDGTQWVRPELVVDVESLGVGAQGRLRQPSYIGIRDDLAPGDLIDQEQS